MPNLVHFGGDLCPLTTSPNGYWFGRTSSKGQRKGNHPFWEVPFDPETFPTYGASKFWEAPDLAVAQKTGTKTGTRFAPPIASF